MDDKIQETKQNNIKDIDSKYITGIKKVKALNLSYILMWITAISATVFIEFARASFTMDALRTADFWSNLIIINIVSIMIMIAEKDRSIAKRKRENKQYSSTIERIDHIVTHQVHADIKEYVSEENRKRKTKYWKSKIGTKIWKLDKIYPSIIFWKTNQKDIDIYNSTDRKAKQNNKYCKKRDRLLEKISDAWIKKNIHIARVKYPVLTEGMITSGSSNAKEDYIPIDNKKEQFKDMTPNILTGTALTLFIFSLMLDFAEFQLVTIAFVLFKLFIIAYRHYYGRAYGIYFVDEKLYPDSRARQGQLRDYLDWRIRQKKDNP